MSKNDWRCRFRRGQMIDALHAQESVVSRKYGGVVSFSEDDSCGYYGEVGQGITDGLLESGDKRVILGVRGLAVPDFSFSKVSDFDAARLMNALFHESRHLEQRFRIGQQLALPESDFYPVNYDGAKSGGFNIACSLIARRNNGALFLSK